MLYRNVTFCILSFLLIITLGASSHAADVEKGHLFEKTVLPLLDKYCNSCHAGEKPKAGVDLSRLREKDDIAVLKERKLLDRVLRVMREQEMPPKDKPKPTSAENERVVSWIDAQLMQLDCGGKKDPGRVTLRRLNRAEYNNTIRDLVGVRFQPADDFPTDDVGYGFDNIGDVLSLSTILLEKYLNAAEKVVTSAFQLNRLRRQILIREPKDKSENAECAREILEKFASRAYRRPVKKAELDRLVKLVETAESKGDNFEKGIQLAMKAVLVSPHFLFRVEMDPEPNTIDNIRTLNDFEVASRLSYFLWSSMPDDELFDLARKGELRKNLNAQVVRMLADSKSSALVENFAGQWLQLRSLKTSQPDPQLFKGFNESLRSAMAQETEMFFAHVIKEDRSILDFLDAGYTFLNEQLARHYGIEGVTGTEFRKVNLTGGQRGGVLTHASVLTVTSNPTRTSPVKRGKWIMENILGTPPPPPPPNAGELSEDKKVTASASLRKRMEQHRANPSCAVCHDKMDALGFSFENYDGVGAWRTKDGQFDIDPAGVLPSGQSFSSPGELKQILKGKAKEFRRCLTEKMLTYALGRGTESYDRCSIYEIAESLAKNEDRISILILGIVNSDPFLKRRGAR